ncbi:hypothetical protein MCAP1_001825 [Malassezia caprae]|uniref:Transcription factor TFIIIC triple barrel domain-containing protein n=1 Tax=Malassezia caprae TaxID=1381934 RepID=A0AAF0EA98_9BASI|nr:hypothetical protein MCAP1_001825 [Malassezia caprae]
MTRPLDASWVRVEDAGAPDGGGWELEQEDSELLVLDMGPAERGPAEERESMPGTSITLTVRIVSHTQGLETETPMMKVGDMVMLGQWDELLGSEIVLCQEPANAADGATWQPIRASVDDAATGASSTSTRRIAFTPVRSQQDAMLDTPSHLPTAEDLPRDFDEDMPLAWHAQWRYTVPTPGRARSTCPIVTAAGSNKALALARMSETPKDEAGELGSEGLRIRGIARRDSESVLSDDEAVPWFLRPPPRASDGDAAWGLGVESSDNVDQALKDKLARFHELKAQGTHFNAALTRNRAFHNPSIHAKLVEWASLDEYGSNYSAIAAAQGVDPSWDAANAEVRH